MGEMSIYKKIFFSSLINLKTQSLKMANSGEKLFLKTLVILRHFHFFLFITVVMDRQFTTSKKKK